MIDEQNESSLHAPVAAASDKPASYKLFWAAVMLISGTFTTLTAKARPQITYPICLVVASVGSHINAHH